MAFFNQNIKDVFKQFSSSENGIASSSVESRKSTYGTNQIEQQKKHGFFKRLLHEFCNIMIVILIISATISLSFAITNKDIENLIESIIIFVIVIINAIVGVLQQQKAENALLLLKQKSSPLATVVRDGITTKIKTSELVVGDVVLLKTGDYVPADLRLFECANLSCDESSLTGESVSAEKNCLTISKNNITLNEQSNMCFSGTIILSGHGKGVVVATGKQTEIGKIAKVLNEHKKEKTPLEKNIDSIGKFISFFVLSIVVIIFCVQLTFNKTTSFLDATLTAVSLAVAAIPESLPAVITIIMALGVEKLAKQNAIVKKLSAVETLGSCTVICTDKTGTLTCNQMSVKHLFVDGKIVDADSFENTNHPIFKTAALCNNATIDESNNINADATETALVKFLLSKNINPNIQKQQFKRITESEFSSTKKQMQVTCYSNGKTMIFIKGALDYLLKTAKLVQINGNLDKLNEFNKQTLLKANEHLCLQGERVIAFAFGTCDADITICGLAGLIDPPRKEVFEAISTCKTAGLKPIMITGDHPATAFAIAKKIGLAKNQKEVLTGEKISQTSKKELAKIISNYSVFARVTPQHKLMIVEALKQNNHIVAMTGDGINDAPSIKTANIGVAMGITGTDVTKDVSDLIIADDNFSTIVLAIKEGRTIYNNITKTITFLLSTNLVEVLGIFVTSLIIPQAVFLFPLQIMFINLITDTLPAFALGVEPAESNIMKQPPRKSTKSILYGKTGSTILYQGFAQTLIVLVMFTISTNVFGPEIGNTMSFLTICFMQVIHMINCKFETSIFGKNIFKNNFLNFSFVFVIALILLIYSTPFLASIFELSKLTATQWLIVTATSISIVPLVEIGKIFIK